MQKTGIMLLLLTLLAGCRGGAGEGGTTGSQDWPFFRGDASLSGYADVRLPGKPVLRWTYRTDTRTVSSPVVKDGITYWCDRRGVIRGIDPEGEPVFEYALNTAVEATPMIYDSTLYIGRIDGYMTAVSLTGKGALWHFETWGQIAASPNRGLLASKQALIVGSYDNYLYCLDIETGEELNKFESGYYLNGAAALWKGYVVYGGCDAWVRVVDCRTGVQTDSLLLDGYVPASPAIRGDLGYVGDYSGNIYKLELEDGKIVRWDKWMEGDSENGSFVSVPALSAEACFFISGDRTLKAISNKDGKEKWQYLLKGKAGESSPVVARDKVIICTKTGIVSILEAGTGELVWEYDTGEQIIGSPAVIDRRFLILTTKGTLLCFAEETNHKQ